MSRKRSLPVFCHSFVCIPKCLVNSAPILQNVIQKTTVYVEIDKFVNLRQQNTARIKHNSIRFKTFYETFLCLSIIYLERFLFEIVELRVLCILEFVRFTSGSLVSFNVLECMYILKLMRCLVV